jgi:leader peptidase (prepilin peptidase)/N-methyltransferase
VVAPPSRCTSCGRELTWSENIPVVSWAVQRGRCRSCGARISRSYLVGELGTAALWALAALLIKGPWWLPVLYGAVFWVLFALALIDLEHKILPNRIVYPATIVAVVAFTLAGLLSGHAGRHVLVQGVVGGAAAFIFFFAVALIAPAGMGMGDVKLSFMIGLALGFFAGWRLVFLGFFVAFLVGAVVGVGLVATGKAGRKSAVPFGPFMALGAVIAVLWAPTLLRLFPNA